MSIVAHIIMLVGALIFLICAGIALLIYVERETCCRRPPEQENK